MLITVKVHPGAKKNAITGVTDGVWQIKVAAPPVEGKANAKLVEFLSDALGVPKSAIQIVRGQTAHTKTVELTGRGELSEAEVSAKLSSYAGKRSK